MFKIKPTTAADRELVAAFIRDHWGAEFVVTRGKKYFPADLPGFAAWQAEKLAGLLTYRIDRGECEIVTLDSVIEKQGIGSALIAAARNAAQKAGCTRLWLITTNDNLHALGFYQKRGFRIAAVHRDAIAESRKLKPSIALIGIDGIPIRDEIELEMMI
ncbi:MAG: GNAT family N-acetyltransferase [Chloroflexi bacterium]|nr:GNAT family N-acetyltransferase [Chloroflexota bacterium]